MTTQTPVPRKRLFIRTWGCQMNVLDGQRMAGQLESRGFRRCGEDELAGVVLLNTCAVREKAQDKVFSSLGVLARTSRQIQGAMLCA